MQPPSCPEMISYATDLWFTAKPHCRLDSNIIFVGAMSELDGQVGLISSCAL